MPCFALVLNESPEPNKDPELDAQNFKRGDVLDFFPIDHTFGREEIGNPKLRIVKLPGNPSDYTDLVASDADLSSEIVKHPPRKRGFDLDDLDKMAGLVKSYDAKTGEVTELKVADLTRLRSKLSTREVVVSDRIIK